MVNDNTIKGRECLYIRISRNGLSFAVREENSTNPVAYEDYPIRKGIAMAANLRSALKDGKLLSRGYRRAMALIDTPVMMLPLQDFSEEEAETFYHYTITGMEGNQVMHQPLANLNAVAVFCINKDLKLVMDEHFAEMQFFPLSYPVWNYMYQHNFTGVRKKLYAYFHDSRMEVFSFERNRFKFCNSFDADHAHDAVYYILYVWQQLGYDAQHDEIHLSGELPESEWMMEALHHYVKNVYLNEFGPLTTSMPLDFHLAIDPKP